MSNDGAPVLAPASPGAFDPDCDRAGRAHRWVAVWSNGVWMNQRRCSTCGRVTQMPTMSEILKGYA